MLDGRCQRTLGIGVGPVYGDRTQAYVARLPASFMGHNASKLHISAEGLLDSRCRSQPVFAHRVRACSSPQWRRV